MVRAKHRSLVTQEDESTQPVEVRKWSSSKSRGLRPPFYMPIVSLEGLKPLENQWLQWFNEL